MGDDDELMTFDSLLGRLDALGRRRRLLFGAIGAAKTAQVAVGLALLTFVLDWLFKLPVGVRVVMAAFAVAAGLLYVVRGFIRPVTRPVSADELALLVEKSDPALNDSLISALQFQRAAAAGTASESPALIQLTVDEAVKALGQRSFSNAVSLTPAFKPALAAAAIVLTATCGWLSYPEMGRLWLDRFVLFRNTPWPKRTNLKIVIVDQDKFTVSEEAGRTVIHVPERSPLHVQVNSEGVVPSDVELVTSGLDDRSEEQRFSMGRPAGKDFFQHIFPPLTQSIVMHAVGGDDQDDDPTVEIRVARAPRVQKFWVDYEYPSYTGLTPRTLPDANISAPEGTRLTFHFQVNMPLQGFDLAFEKAGSQPMSPGADGSFTRTLIVEQSDFYTYRLTGENGIASVDVPRYVITAEPDQTPRVQVDLPGSDSLICTPDAVIPLRGTATDDYGIAKLALRWGATDDTLPLAVDIAGDALLSPMGGRSVSFYRDLTLRDLSPPAGPESRPAGTAAGLAVGDQFRFKFLATDNRVTPTQPEPHRQFGDHTYMVQVLAPTEVERELAQRQSRLRERVNEILVLAQARKQETDDVRDSLSRKEMDAKVAADKLIAIESGQTRVSTELAGATRQFMRVFDGYLYNRLDPGNLTEKLLTVLGGLYRTSGEADPFKLYGQAVATVRPQASEAEVMGRLTVIVEIFLRSAAERSPEAARRLGQAGLVSAKPECVDMLRSAGEMQQLLIEDLKLLEEKLEAWEDYLDVVQGVRDLIEAQQGIKKKAEQLTK